MTGQKQQNDEKKQIKSFHKSKNDMLKLLLRLAGRPDWLGGQIGWEARLAGRPDWLGLAGRPDWLGGQIGWKARLAERPNGLGGQLSQ
jgi:hypothetical protein